MASRGGTQRQARRLGLWAPGLERGLPDRPGPPQDPRLQRQRAGWLPGLLHGHGAPRLAEAAGVPRAVRQRLWSANRALVELCQRGLPEAQPLQRERLLLIEVRADGRAPHAGEVDAGAGNDPVRSGPGPRADGEGAGLRRQEDRLAVWRARHRQPRRGGGLCLRGHEHRHRQRAVCEPMGRLSVRRHRRLGPPAPVPHPGVQLLRRPPRQRAPPAAALRYVPRGEWRGQRVGAGGHQPDARRRAAAVDQRGAAGAGPLAGGHRRRTHRRPDP
mmetsp:Transcript_73093/g.190738  ORF Transcript_73093/g.190738 Transcript_73093/m.190738 type:complete len:273 (-) Transcript_73093:661-1479(-)